MGLRICVAVLTTTASVFTAQAKEVRYPAAHPEVSLNVPDDWSVAETQLGLELQSPQKDALVLAGLTAGDRKSVDDWSKRALQRMDSEGVVFAKTGSAKTGSAKSGAKTSSAKTSSAKTSSAEPAAPQVAPPDAAAAASPAKAAPPQTTARPRELTSDVAKMHGDLPYTFGGAPLVDPLKATAADPKAPLAGAADAADLPSISTIPSSGGNPGALKPSGHFAYTGGTMRGQPVDVELAVFPLAKDKRLLIEQQSGPTDARGVMIVRSLRDLTQ